MEIKKIEQYRIDGQNFGNLSQVKEYVENQIGSIIDKTPLRLNPKDRLAVFQAITDKENRIRLAMLLCLEIQNDDLQGECTNILDF